MNRRAARVPSQRQLRVGEELRHAIAWIVERGEIRDPAVSDAAVTVTEVRISPDLKSATVYVVPLGGHHTETVLEGLARAAPFLRRRVAERVRLRYVPRLSFVADTSFDEADHINTLLHDPSVSRDLTGEEPDSEDGP